MIKINLISEARLGAPRRAESRFRLTGKTNNFLFIGTLLLGVFYVLGMWMYLGHVKSGLDEQIRKAQAEVDRLKSIIDEVNAYEKKKADLEAKINLINDLKRNQKGPVRLMDEVSKALPDLVWLTDLNLTGNVISMKGMAMTPNAVANFIENLKKSPYFAEPNFGGLAQAGGIYSFGMSVTFTYLLPTQTTTTTTTTTTTAAPATAAGKPKA